MVILLKTGVTEQPPLSPINFKGQLISVTLPCCLLFVLFWSSPSWCIL